MADNVAITAGAGTTVATDDVSSVHYQRVKLVDGTLDSTAAIAGDATNGLDVDVTRVKPDGTNTMPSGDATARPIFVKQTDGTTNRGITTNGEAASGGGVAHDGVDSGNPVKLGMRALAHGTNPTAVAAADRTDWLANRHGVPWVIGGHPNVVSYTHTAITTAVTDSALVTVGAGTKIVVTGVSVSLDNASTVFPTVRIGFGTASVPALGSAGVVYAHGGFPAGGQANRGDGSGILGVGADGEDLRVTTTGNATGNGLIITVTYYTVES